MSTRRGFLGALLAAAAAPAIVRADSLMKIVAPRQGLILWGDGIHDDAAALQALIDGKPVDVRHRGFHRSESGRVLVADAQILVSKPIDLRNARGFEFVGCHFRGSKPMPYLLHLPVSADALRGAKGVMV